MTKNNINKAPEEASSQVQIISKPLKLETANEGRNEDDVLVRGTDNIVKYVPQSSLGGGGSAGLQQVLNTNHFASFGDGNSWISLFGEGVNAEELQIRNYIPDTGNEYKFSLGRASGLNLENASNSGFARIKIDEGTFNLFKQTSTSLGTTLTFQTPIADSSTNGTGAIIKIPAKPNGNYTLATLDDITGGGSQDLQQTLNNGKIAEYDGGNTYISLGDGDVNNRNVQAGVGDGVSFANVYVSNTDATFQGVFTNDTDGTIYESKVGIQNGLIKLRQQDNVTSKFIDIKVPTAIPEDVTFNFPEKPDGGNFTIATTLQEAFDGTAATQGGNNVFGSIYNSEIDQHVGIVFSLSPNGGSPEGVAYLQSFIAGMTKAAYVGVKNGNIDLFMQGDLGKSNLKFADPITAEVNLILPAKPLDGDYTLATRDEITLQKALENNGEAYFDSEDNYVNLMTGSAYNRAAEIHVQSEDASLSASMDIRNDRVMFGNDGGAEYSTSLQMFNGSFQIGQEFNTNATYVNFEDPVSVATLKFPAKTTTGTYTLATIEDLAVDNSTTSALSSTTLNSTYSSAVNGFRVHCPYISTGAIIYEKSSIGWLQYAVTITQ